MDAFQEFLEKYRDQLPIKSGKGWGGCTCSCHLPDSGMSHFQACCQPSQAEIAELLELFRQDPEAEVMVHKCINQLRQDFAFDNLGRLGGLLRNFGRF